MINNTHLRMLIFSRSFPPRVGGTSRILAGLLSQFPSDALTTLTESTDDEFGGEWLHSVRDIRRINVGLPPFFHSLGLGAVEWCWVIKRVQIAKSLIRKEGYNCILGVIPGPEYVAAAYLTHKATGLPLYLYYIDTTLSYPGEPRWRRKHLDRYENRWLDAAREIFVLSEGLAQDLQDRLGVTRFTILRHSLTPDMFSVPEEIITHDSNTARLLFVGNVRRNTHLRPLGLVIKALEELTIPRGIHLEIFTRVSRARLVSLGLKDTPVWSTSYCGPEQTLDEERNSDLLLVLLDNQSPLQPLLRTVFPTKTVEAMVTGVPILVIAPEDTYTACYARSAGFAYVVNDFCLESIRDAVIKLLTDMELCSRQTKQARNVAETNHDARKIVEFFHDRIVKKM